MSDSKIQINLRILRQRAGLSLSQASELTGVSKAMLGQIERGESSPTIATLWKLAKGFHLPLTAFIEDLVETADTYVPAAPHPVRLEQGIGFNTIFPFDPRFGSETLLMTLAPGESHTSNAHDTGVVEDIFVVTGAMELLQNGEWQKLALGDGVRFPADQPHGYRNVTGAEATFYHTIHYPKVGTRSVK